MAQSVKAQEANGVAATNDLELQVEHLRKALLTRDVIGQAKGILMERFRITADEAFGLLVRASQRDNVRVADLSLQLADTGEWLGPTPA